LLLLLFEFVFVFVFDVVVVIGGGAEESRFKVFSNSIPVDVGVE
jgi:hypothetical protein